MGKFKNASFVEVIGDGKDNDAHTQALPTSGGGEVEVTAPTVQTKVDDELAFVGIDHDEAFASNGPRVGRAEVASDMQFAIDGLEPRSAHFGSTYSKEKQRGEQRSVRESQRSGGRNVKMDSYGDRGDNLVQDKGNREYRVGGDIPDGLLRLDRGPEHHGQRNTEHQRRSSANIITISDGRQQALGRAENKIRELEARIRVLQSEMQGLMNVSQHKDALLEQNRELLNLRMTELKGAQTFLTTEDHTSIADVVRTVKSLNEEIFQAAAFMADSLQDRLGNRSMIVNDDSEAAPSTGMRNLVGQRLLELLRSSQDKEEAEILSQHAIQACLAACSRREVGRWAVHPAENHYLNCLYGEIIKTGDFTISCILLWP